MPILIPPVVAAGAMANSPQREVVIDNELTLRPFCRSDALTVVRAFADPDIQHWHFRRYDTLEEAEAWIENCLAGWQSETSATWAIVLAATDEVVGRVTVYTTLKDGYGELSYWVLPEARGEGVATRAARAATTWAHEFGLHRVQLEHSTRNPASGHVAINAGYVSEGIRRGANLHDDGWHDMHFYSHLATD